MKTLKPFLVFLVATARLASLLKWLAVNFGPRSLAFAFLGNWLMLFNLPVNLYPMFLQRYNRAGLEKAARYPAPVEMEYSSP